MRIQIDGKEMEMRYSEYLIAVSAKLMQATGRYVRLYEAAQFIFWGMGYTDLMAQGEAKRRSN